MILSIKVLAYDALVNGIYYDFSGTEATVTNNGFGSYSGTITIPATVTYETIEYNVTAIGFAAFRECNNLTSVTIPNSVTSIDHFAFTKCNRLTSLVIPSSVTSIGSDVFRGCSALTSLVIPSSVTTIGNRAFSGCSGLASLIIPNSVISIGEGVLIGCNGLTSLNVENGNTKYDSRDNCNAIIETETNTLISAINNTIIPNSVTSIADYAFCGLINMTSMTIPNGVSLIGYRAFMGCSGLTSLAIPNSVTSIGKEAFYGCSALTSVIIPNSVIFIGVGIFSGCSGLTSLKVENGNTKFDSRDNCNAIIETETNTLISGTNNTIIPNSVTSIGKEAFYLCMDIVSMAIPNGVTSIDERAFEGCRGLISLTIPNSVTTIGNVAFASCTGLTSVTIPSSVTSIGEYAFQSCNSLTSVTVEAKTPITISEMVFTNRANATLYVPAGSKDAYETADYWKEFKEIIEMEDPSVLTVNVETAGELSDLISNHDVDPLTITDLTITGPLNSTDLRLIREMAGNDDSGKPTDGMLKKLDLSGANIVEDDEKYLDTDQIISSTQESMPNIGDNSFHFATQENVLGTALFAGCDKLEEIVLPNSIEAIGDYVFWNCLNLKALEIPKNVSSIGWRFINGQNDISKLSVAEGNQTFSSPDGSNALMKGTELVFGLSSTKIPTGTTIIGSEAFYICTGLGDVTLPEGVTTIKGGAFAWSDLTSIKMPSTLTTIENDAFADCSGLTSFTLPKSVTHYGEGLGALKECGNLASIKVEDGNTKYDSRDNCNAIIETATKTLVSGCKNTVIPNTVTSIGHQAFRGINLSDFDIPNCITTLGERAFWSSSLTSIKIPSSVTKIGELAFEYCNNLTSVSVEAKTPLVITENTFSNRANATLYVPQGCVDAYKAADYWKEFKEIIEIEDPSVLTVNVETAGSLSDLISNEDVDAFTITDLTITGQLNGTDFRLLREMAGCDYLGRPTNGQLQKLDLSGATIVAGGDKYFDSDGLYDEEGIMQYGFNSHSVTTRDNVIGECLFAGCSKLEEIKIPANTIEIGDFAFMCTNISSFDIPEAVVKVALPFFYGTKMSTLHIPQNVATLTASYFMGNQATLSSITVDANNAKFDSRNNCNAIIEKESNTLLLGCKNTTIPDGVTSIGEYAFSYSYGYTSITLPTSVTSLQEGAFFASGLASISLPSALKRIEFNALAYTNIASITIPASVEFIGQSALRACSNLTQVTVEAGNTKYDSRDNCNAIIETASNTLIQGCKTSTIPATVTALGNQAFQECYDLASITIPSSVTSIADNAFFQCNNLTSVSVEIKTPLVITGNTFSNRANATLYVPTGSKTAYQSADYWKEFMAIEEISMVLPADKLFSGSNLWAGYVASVDLAIPTGLGAYVITNLGTTSATASPLDYIPQGAPVLLKRDDTTITSYEFASGTGTAPTMNLLKVYDTDKNVSNREGFILYNDEFVLVNEGTLPAGRVFLPANNGLLSRGLTRSIEIDDDNATGIEDNKMFVDDAGEQWFDLQGRKLEKKPTKNGLYILNGRKVIVK